MKRLYSKHKRFLIAEQSLEPLINSSSPSIDTNDSDFYNTPIDFQIIDSIFHNTANEGRNILKHIENFNYNISKTLDMLNAVPDLQKKMQQKQNILNSAATQIYGIVFDLENYDLTPNYEDEQLAIDVPDYSSNSETLDNDWSEEDEQNDETIEDNDENNEEEEIDINNIEDIEDIEDIGSDEEPKMQGGFEDDSESSGEEE